MTRRRRSTFTSTRTSTRTSSSTRTPLLLVTGALVTIGASCRVKGTLAFSPSSSLSARRRPIPLPSLRSQEEHDAPSLLNADQQQEQTIKLVVERNEIEKSDDDDDKNLPTNIDSVPPKAKHDASSVSRRLASLLGTDIDEQRLTFPELSTGEVPRLFSSLEFTKSEKNYINETTTVATHAPGSTMGAAALVAGTTIGAGVLALPTATVAAGFLPSTFGMTVAWIIMTASGLLIAELSLNRMGETGRPGLGLLDLYNALLGQTFGAVASVAYFFLHYAVMCAYMAQGGSNMKSLLASALSSDFEALSQAFPGIGQLLFVGIGGVAIYTAKQSVVEQVNNAMVLGVLASFLGILTLGVGSADFGALLSPANQHPESLVSAIPILFLSIVFHNVVPTVVVKLEGDRSKITKAIVTGTTMPFLMLVAWNAVILANVLGTMGSDASSVSVDPVSLLRQSNSGDSLLGSLVGTFSELALITSLVGFVYGMLDAWTDVFSIPSKGPEFQKWRPALFAGVLLPPLLLSMSDPDIFYKALDYGGAFGVTTLFLVLPPIMVWKLRYGSEQAPLTTKPMVPLGKIPLVIMLGVAGALISQQAFDKLGISAFLQDNLQIILKTIN